MSPSQVPERFTFVIESCSDAHLFVGLAMLGADRDDPLHDPLIVAYRSNGTLRIFDRFCVPSLFVRADWRERERGNCCAKSPPLVLPTVLYVESLNQRP